MCENYVLNLLDHQQSSYDLDRYQYNNYDASRRVSKKRRVKRCGQPFRKTRMLKIIGGVEAKKHKWPWHVAILNRYHVFVNRILIKI